MVKKETYFTCSDGNIFEGMTSISAIINHAEKSPATARHINKILYDREKTSSKIRELSYLRRKAAMHGYVLEPASSNELEKYTTGNTHGGFIAFCNEREIPLLLEHQNEIKQDGVYIMLDGIEDPYNFGYSLRSIYASGADGVILSPRNWLNVAGIVAKSSAGASELLDMYIATSEEAVLTMKACGYRVVAAGIRNSISMWDADLKKPVFLIVGGEKRGISTSLLALADQVVRIDYGREFRGSLSAASAATVLSYEILRQNHQ